MALRVGADRLSSERFRHEAMLYEGMDGFLGGVVPWLQQAISDDEPVLVVVSKEKIDLISAELGRDAAHVDFADMSEIGHNPARIIPAWYEFVADRAPDGRHIRGIGEPISAERSPDALIECQRHESLLNLAFAEASAWWLLCPYDVTLLPSDVIDEAMRSHPYVLQDGSHRDSTTFVDLDQIAKPFDIPLPDPRGAVTELTFGVADLDAVRKLAAQTASAEGLAARRIEDFVLAVNEIATNSLRHGGGKGAMRLWREGATFLCDVVDAGLIDLPLVGRKRPDIGQEGGFGIWLTHQICDLVQIRSLRDGNVVRLHMMLN